MRRPVAMGFMPALFFIFLIAGTIPATTSPPARRVVAVADIHGDYDSFVRILQKSGLVDSKLKWIGGDTVLIQTGDYVDRGPKTRAVLDLLMDLQRQKRNQVIVLLGNHEVSVILGDLRYVVPSDYASFAAAKSEEKRKAAYQAFAAVRENPPPESEWMKSHPPGFIEHREAFGPGGKYGRWLRSLPAIAQVDDSIFLHGGLSLQLASWNVKKLNDGITAELNAFDAYKKFMVEQKIALPFFTLDELAEAANTALKATDEKDVARKTYLEAFLGFPGWLGVHPEGPLWFRGFAQWSDEEGERNLTTITKAYNVSRFVVGHTVQPQGQISSRFGGKVFLIDTGMLSGYYPGGRASALEILNGKVTPIYP